MMFRAEFKFEGCNIRPDAIHSEGSPEPVSVFLSTDGTFVRIDQGDWAPPGRFALTAKGWEELAIAALKLRIQAVEAVTKAGGV